MLTPEQRLSAEGTIRDVAEWWDMAPEEIYGRGRDSERVEVRMAAITCLYSQGFTVTQIAELLNRHHTTICQYLNASYKKGYRT